MTRAKHTSGCRLRKTPHPPRRLKVRESYHSYQLSQRYRQRTPIGEIHLKGHWLIRAGFAIDTPVTVQVRRGRLVITIEQQP